MPSRDLRYARPPAAVDLLRWPLVGRFFRWRHARSFAQASLLILALLVIFDGFLGPSIAPKNLAGVLPWVHWRGLIVLALLLTGNFFCFSCPFLLPRRLSQRVLQPHRNWPRWLPGKVLAIGLLVVFFWAYEAFDLWASPLLTAWIVIAYFVGAFAIDGVFRGAAFCKHVCPIGQFNFLGSLLSPMTVTIRDRSICMHCTTKDCISGRRTPSGLVLQRGCELGLFQPRKVGNLDCTFCLDCLHACPYANVTLRWRVPLHDEFDLDPNRSGIGRLSRRTDWLFLVISLTALGFLNAFGMVSPVYRFLAWLSETLHIGDERLLLAFILLGGIGSLGLLVLIAAVLAARFQRTRTTSWFFRHATFTLAPLGFGMWTAHYLFHFLTGGATIIPLFQQLVLDWTGRALLGHPAWHLASLLPLDAVHFLVRSVLFLGFVASVIWLYDLSHRAHLSRSALLPWLVLLTGLLMSGLWLLAQPMEMRGTLLG